MVGLEVARKLFSTVGGKVAGPEAFSLGDGLGMIVGLAVVVAVGLGIVGTVAGSLGEGLGMLVGVAVGAGTATSAMGDGVGTSSSPCRDCINRTVITKSTTTKTKEITVTPPQQ